VGQACANAGCVPANVDNAPSAKSSRRLIIVIPPCVLVSLAARAKPRQSHEIILTEPHLDVRFASETLCDAAAVRSARINLAWHLKTITLPHFSVHSAMKAPNSADELANTA